MSDSDGLKNLGYYVLLDQALSELCVSSETWKRMVPEYSGGVEEFYFSFEDLMYAVDFYRNKCPGESPKWLLDELDRIKFLFDSGYDLCNGRRVDILSQEAFLHGERWQDIRDISKRILLMIDG